MREYLRSWQLLETNQYSRNLIKGIDTWTVPLVRYKGPVLWWTREHLKQMDQRTRNVMTMLKSLHPRDDVDTLCVKKIRRKRSYVVHSIGFQTFFVQTFKIFVDSWKFPMLLLYIICDDWPIFSISASNEQLQQQLECTLLKPDCHS